ncbi:putative HTH-type transcriptional regulator YcgE [Leptospira kobayashii]|uniref:HTH-type transcriptional regulator YcgE n=1 Tax=Leptospira kobayashii TaxID=1917830 RepID=A0ABN6KC26_9LEPT|nr:MarR family transcriptional regulator [Leptospira kobayashii]BDA78532.1 putative HTH-type transcriptional regulator YcgE [Leptospira kobayashii]
MQEKKTSKSKESVLESYLKESKNLSTATILFHQKVAEKLGLHITDHKCLDFLLTKGAQTAGELSRLTGLSTGAITSLIDRLEKKNLVIRKNDPEDRRKVLVHPVMNPKFFSLIGEIFGNLSNSAETLLSSYNEKEQKLILEYTIRSKEMMEKERERLSGG